MVELVHFETDDQAITKNKLRGITEMTLNLDELDNTDMVDLVTPYSLITWMLIKILHVSNPTPCSTRNLKMENLLP